MLVPELFGLFYSVPTAVDDANSAFFDVFEVVAVDGLFGERWKNDSSELFLFVFDAGQQFKPFHFFASAFLGIAMFKIHHKKRYSLLRLFNYLPFALSLFLLFLLLLHLFFSLCLFFWLFVDIHLLELFLDLFLLLQLHSSHRHNIYNYQIRRDQIIRPAQLSASSFWLLSWNPLSWHQRFSLIVGRTIRCRGKLFFRWWIRSCQQMSNCFRKFRWFCSRQGSWRGNTIQKQCRRKEICGLCWWLNWNLRWKNGLLCSTQSGSQILNQGPPTEREV